MSHKSGTSSPGSLLPDKKTKSSGTQVHERGHPKASHGKHRMKGAPCPWLCNLVPSSVPAPGATQGVLHPRKDVFVLKVAKVGANGDRRCKMELELVTPKGPEKKPPGRVDTRETQYEPEPCPCCCSGKPKKKR